MIKKLLIIAILATTAYFIPKNNTTSTLINSTYQPHQPINLDSLRGDFIHHTTKSMALESPADQQAAREIMQLVLAHFPDSEEAIWMVEMNE